MKLTPILVRITAAVTIAAAGIAAAQSGDPANNLNPRAAELFERHWVLKDWALRFYDRDHDALLSPVEASTAADGFKRIADGDRDQQVTTHEYRRAIEFLLARY